MEERIKKIDKKYYGIIAFLLASLAAYLTLSFSQMLSNGIYIVMDADFIEQYIAFIKMFFRNILEGESLEYSWSNSLGMNTSLLYAYYVMSPFNLLYLIFWGVEENVITAAIIILKIGLSAYTFWIFEKRVLKCCGPETIFFALSYSLCSYVMLYGTTYNSWLEGVYMLPLICAYIYGLFDNGKIYKLTIAYAFLFISQFYVGYMVGIFSFVFWCVLLALKCKKGIANRLKEMVKYGSCVVLSIGIATGVWLPALLFFKSSIAGETESFPPMLTTIIDLWNNLFWGQMQGVEGIYPYIYCGLPVLLLLPFFFINKKIDVRMRITFAVMMLFMILTMLIEPMYQMIHVFDVPNSYGYRQTFLFSFVLCALACKQSVYWKELKIKWLAVWAGICSCIYALAGILLNRKTPEFNSNSILFWAINLIFMISWIIMIYIKQRKKVNAVPWVMLLLLIGMVEMCTSGYNAISKDLALVGRKQLYYENWKTYIEDAVQQVKEDKDLYRMYCIKDYVANSDSWFGYNGISDFSTAENDKVRLFCRKIGMYSSSNTVEIYGITEPMEMILGVKYCAILPSPYLSTQNEVVEIRTNPYYVSLGFAVDESALECELTEPCAFENINQILTSMTGEEIDCFERISQEEMIITTENASLQQLDDSVVINRLSGGNKGSVTYFWENQGNEPAYVQFIRDNSYVSSRSPILLGGIENQVFDKGMATVSYIKALEQNQVTVVMNDDTMEECSFKDIVFYKYNANEIEKCYELLNANTMNVLEYGNTYIHAEIEMPEEKEILFTSIPYDVGWEIKADGQSTEIIPILDETFIAVCLEPGYHDLVFEYQAPGLTVGKMVSFISIGFYLLIATADYIRIRKRKAKEGTIEPDVEDRTE